MYNNAQTLSHLIHQSEHSRRVQPANQNTVSEFNQPITTQKLSSTSQSEHSSGVTRANRGIKTNGQEGEWKMCEGLCSSVEFLSVKGFVSNQMCHFDVLSLLCLAKLTRYIL